MVRPSLSNLSLPGGVTLSLSANSFNYNHARYLANPTDTTVPRTFVFDCLNFESGTTRLTPESMQTVQDLVVILKVYPTAAVQLEGYTDSTGDAAANKKLSQDRADAVKELLVKGGIDTNRLGTAGYGQEKPIASNATEDGRLCRKFAFLGVFPLFFPPVAIGGGDRIDCKGSHCEKEIILWGVRWYGAYPLSDRQ